MGHFNLLHVVTFFFRKFFVILFGATLLFLTYSAVIKSSGKPKPRSTAVTLINRLEHPYLAPSLADISDWINSQPINLDTLKGKVILIDFWTYSCINCIRTIPYIKEWYAKYHQKGFEVIGIHSPEFAFEHKLQNVKRAVNQQGITYPVALDNHFTTWQNFHNEYWPAQFLINQKGEVVYEHFGEGEYDVTENNIRYLLGLKEPNTVALDDDKYSPNETAEIYLGYDRAKNFANAGLIKNKAADYQSPSSLSTHQWALQGKWIVYPDKIVAAHAGAVIKLHFFAENVHAIMGFAKRPVRIKILLNENASGHENGKDLNKALIKVVHNQLYSIAKLTKEGEGFLELKATNPGLEVYAFTFGS